MYLICNIASPNLEIGFAQMAELVDASDSKSGIGNNVQVRFLFWALKKADNSLIISLLYF
jgi:hypothetical protein